MSNAVDPGLLVPRTCTTLDEKSGTRESRPLADFRDASAYVLLGDPGAGKTESFKREAEATGGHYIRARSFAALDPGPQLAGKALFIDGLDEMRAGSGDGRTPLDHIRRPLDRLGRPAFRLSCREADWYGDSDSASLLEIAPGGSLAVLHLDPLSEGDIALLLDRKFGVADPADFVRQAEQHGLADLLRNPQTLGLLASAVGATHWPDSRGATYELACKQLVRETNAEHRQAGRTTAPTIDALLDAAGFLCAVHLLAGIAGFALDDDAADAQHMLWRELSFSRELPLPTALASGLFQHDERDQQRIPIHRSIAEYLGARHLATLIETDGLPLGRIVALMAGEDGGIVPDLRGLAAWLAVHCRSGRSELVGRDPLGVVLYGDVRNFPLDDKRRVLAALKGEAERYAHFRFENWAAAPFGALATPDMVPVFLELLASPLRSPADVALLDCVLDALFHGPPLQELVEPIALVRLDLVQDAVARDASYPSHIRHAALRVLLRELPRNAEPRVALAKDVLAGTVVDEDDQILGMLLAELYPEHIPPTAILDYLHPRKQRNLLGSYDRFWRHGVATVTSDDDLPLLLDQLVQRKPPPRKPGERHEAADMAARMAGGLLARGIELHGDSVAEERLYDWLGVGLDEYGRSRIDGEQQARVTYWLEARPERYKAQLREGVNRCVDEEGVVASLFRSATRLYGATPPTDIVPWYLEQAAREAHAELARHYFERAAIQLVRQGGQDCLTLDNLEILESWVAKHKSFQALLESFVSLPIDDWRKEDAAMSRADREEMGQQRDEWLHYFRDHVDAIRNGIAHPKTLHDLTEAYLGHFYDISGDTPHERLADFLGGDSELIEAAYEGFRRSLARGDLPSVAEIVDLEAQGQMHFIRQPCLVGIEELYRADPDAAMRLDDTVLKKLLAFHFTWLTNEDPDWFAALVRARSALVAEVLVAYALPLLRKGHEHLNAIWSLAHDEAYGEVARAALPDLLKGFPLRAKNKQLSQVLDPLLKASLRHLDWTALAALLSARLAQGSMSAAQRVYWLACGLLIVPQDYETALARHIGASKAQRGHLGGFLHDRERRPTWSAALPESALALLIELLAPDSPPERPVGAHRVSAAMQTADEVRNFIDILGGIPSKVATQQLARLLSLPRLAPWHEHLRRTAHVQRIARRKARFRRLDAREVCRTLADREPANAADLAALAYDHLRDLARKIRDGSTNDYRQYWCRDAVTGKPTRPLLENDCRDTLLSDLKERLGMLGVEADKEGYYAEDKRADIRISFGGAQGFNVPIEIKKDSHANLWRAIREQLIERYTRDPGADGFGIYLVFWFGGKDMPLQEGKKPRSAAELEERLRQSLTAEENRRIFVRVIDCALP